MSFSLHCFEGLSIKRCALNFGCCRKRRPSDNSSSSGSSSSGNSQDRRHNKRKASKPGRIMLIHDTALSLTVVSAPNRRLETLGSGENAKQLTSWDFLTVDKDSQLVMLTGDRFLDLAGNDPDIMTSADACRGRHISDVFSKPILDILTPLIDMTLEGKSPQLHTIFKSHSLTLFAYPMYNEVRSVIGAHIIYRPTAYDKTDITNLINRASTDVVR